MKKFSIDNFPNIGAVIATKMITEQNYKPRFIVRNKPLDENDSGWVIFSGMESDEYLENPNSFGIYSAKNILNIDDSIAELLLYKGIGSVFELGDDLKWKEVFDYPLEDDFMIDEKITKNFKFNINNLFIRKVEDDGTLMFTTGDKTIRMDLWNYDVENKEKVIGDKLEYIESNSNAIKKFRFDGEGLIKAGYLIKEYDEYKDLEYNLICGFSISDNQILDSFFYFDDDNDLDWALKTWKNINYINER